MLSGVRVRIGCIASTLRTGHSCDDLKSWPRSPHRPECSQPFRSSQLCPSQSHPPPTQIADDRDRGARGETKRKSSENQVMTYPYYAGSQSPPHPSSTIGRVWLGAATLTHTEVRCRKVTSHNVPLSALSRLSAIKPYPLSECKCRTPSCT